MSEGASAQRLSRASLGLEHPAPVRIVHIGLGAFHRAHQAWYTQNAIDGSQWGIAAFTGRTADAALHLEPQDGLYTLIERGELSDRFQVISTIVQVASGDDLATFIDLMCLPDVAIVSLTITEAGYRLDELGGPDLADPAVADDVSQLRSTLGGSADLRGAIVTTAMARLLLGLEARRRAALPPLAIVPCDNLPNNGSMVRLVLEQLAALVHPELAAWLPTGVSVVSTSVDRITPRTTDADKRAVIDETGWRDESPVVCEEFSDWVLSGDFPSGRPTWETAGARFVSDIEPWEQRKLWMLNGAHTLLAAFGLLRGHSVVSAAIADPEIRALVDGLWQEDARHLPGVEVDQYKTQLLSRFQNPRIEHQLTQIAADTITKLRLRIVPVAALERSAARSAAGCAAVLAAWALAVSRGLLERPAGLSATASVADLVSALDTDLGADRGFCDTVSGALQKLTGLVESAPH